jgi:hypothetical protein
MLCSVKGGDELGRLGRWRCGWPWWGEERLEVEGGADMWVLVGSS